MLRPTSRPQGPLWGAGSLIGTQVRLAGDRAWPLVAAIRRQPAYRLGVLAVLVAIAGGVAFYLLERQRVGESASLWDGLWWALVTMTTVGYGDVVPHTGPQRLVAMGIMFVGIGVVSLVTATIASALVAERIKEARGLETIDSRGHTLLCGWNDTADKVLEGLVQAQGRQLGDIVLINELPEEAINEILFKYHSASVRYVRGDYCHEAVLLRANVGHAAKAVIVPDTSNPLAKGSDEQTVLATLAIKTLNPRVKVSAQILSSHNEQHLRQANADEIVVSGEFSSYLLSAATVTPGIPKVVRALLNPGSGAGLITMAVPKEFVGRNFRDLSLHLRQTEGVLPVAVLIQESGLQLEDVLGHDYTPIDEFIRHQFSSSGKERLATQLEQVGVEVNPPEDRIMTSLDLVVVIPRPPR